MLTAGKTGTGVKPKGPKGEDYMKKPAKAKDKKADEMCEGSDDEMDEKAAAAEDEDADEYTDDEEKNQERPKKSKKASAAAVELAKAELAAAKARLALLAAKKDDKEDEEEEDDSEPDSTSDDEEDEEEEPKASPKKKGAAATIPVRADRANSAAVEISELCAIAGMPELTGSYLAKGYSVTQVRRFLNARRIKANQENQVSSSFSFGGSASGMSSLDRAIMQAKVVAGKRGITESQALADLLAENPEIYEEYDETRRRVALQGTNKDIVAYAKSQQRVMKALHLGTDFGSPPSAMAG